MIGASLGGAAVGQEGEVAAPEGSEKGNAAAVFSPLTALPDPAAFRAGSQTASGFLTPAGAAYAGRSGFHFSIDQAIRYDDNVRKLPTSRAVPAGQSRGDLYSVTTLGASYRKTIGLQQVFVNGSFGNTSYRSNSTLDKTSYNVTAGIDWRLGQSCSGTLSGGADQSEQPLDSTIFGQANSLVQSQSVNYSGRCHLYQRIYATYGTSFRNVTYSQSPNNGQNQLSYNLGLEYSLPKWYTIGFRYSQTNVDYENPAARAANGLSSSTDQAQYVATFRWIISPKTNIDSTVGVSELSTTTALFGARSVMAPVYSVSASWRPSSKIALRAAVENRVSPAQGITADYQESQSYSLSMAYTFSPKLSFVTAVSRTRSLNPTFQPLLGVTTGRTLTTTTLSLDANYRFSSFWTANLGYRFTGQTDKQTRDRTNSNLFTIRVTYQR